MKWNSIHFKDLPEEILNKKLDRKNFPFSKKIFWDTPIINIDMELHKNFIIERILSRGAMEDLFFMSKIYNEDEVKNAIVKSKVLDKKTANWCSIVYNIPKNEIYASPFYS